MHLPSRASKKAVDILVNSHVLSQRQMLNGEGIFAKL